MNHGRDKCYDYLRQFKGLQASMVDLAVEIATVMRNSASPRRKYTFEEYLLEAVTARRADRMASPTRSDVIDLTSDILTI